MRYITEVEKKIYEGLMEKVIEYYSFFSLSMLYFVASENHYKNILIQNITIGYYSST